MFWRSLFKFLPLFHRSTPYSGVTWHLIRARCLASGVFQTSSRRLVSAICFLSSFISRWLEALQSAWWQTDTTFATFGVNENVFAFSTKTTKPSFSHALSDLATYQIGFFNRDTFNGQQSPFTKTKHSLRCQLLTSLERRRRKKKNMKNKVWENIMPQVLP